MKAGTLHFAALLGGASAHTIFTNLVDGDTVYDVGQGIRVPDYDGPISDVTTDAIACNGGPNPTTPSDKIITVQAGSTVQATWRHTLDSGPDDVIDASHLGPVMAYMKKVDDAVSDDGIGDGWFKISEAGLDASGDWAVTKLIGNQGLQDIPIPACLENGQYLLRPEIIALHGATAPGGAQFYMECAQLKVEGGGGGASPDTISLPGEYSADDPGITVDIYNDLSSYEIPGPEVFKC